MSGDFTVTSIMTVGLCPATASALRENTQSGLTELRLWGCHIDPEGISDLVQALHVNTTLRVLDLSYNTIDSKSAAHLGKLSGGVWGYGFTCNIRLCQCATSNREMSVVQKCVHQNVNLRWSNAPVLRYYVSLLLMHSWMLIIKNSCEKTLMLFLAVHSAADRVGQQGQFALGPSVTGAPNSVELFK